MPPKPKRNSLPRLIALICLLVIIDQVSKAVVRKTLPLGGSISFIDEVLRITFSRNYSGFSWWVPPLPDWAKLVLQMLLAFIVLAAVPVYLFYTQTRRESIWVDIAFVGISAAGLGHLLDGFFVPYTTDFIQIFHSPGANFADLYSYLGLVALTVEMILSYRIKKTKWKGLRHFLAERARTRREFFAFLRKEI